MKIRIFKKLVDGVFSVRVQTEDWSENDRSLMVRHGEPEIDLGGAFYADDSSHESSSAEATIVLPTFYVRVMTESPFVRKFDSRDLGGTDGAKAIACLWAKTIEDRIADKVGSLRSMEDGFTTEEVTEY